MLQPVQKEIWNEKVQESGLHSCLHDKSHQYQYALHALWEQKDFLELKYRYLGHGPRQAQRVKRRYYSATTFKK